MSLKPEFSINDGSIKSYIEINKKHIKAIAHEYWEAKRKHPDFASAIIDPSSRVSWAESEARIKLRNSSEPQCADNILMEEVAEAFAAYQQGDKAQALHEFAQCGAVILRIMEKIDKEIQQ